MSWEKKECNSMDKVISSHFEKEKEKKKGFKT